MNYVLDTLSNAKYYVIVTGDCNIVVFWEINARLEY